MADIPEYLSKDHTLEVQSSLQLTIGWGGWPSEYTNAKKRTIIKKRLVASGFCINPSPVIPDSLVDFEIEDVEDLEASAVIDGICFVRAFYDSSDDTGVIKINSPVVFDTVTGRCITGINDAWSTDEYVIVGTSLVDYDSTEEDGEDIPVKLSTITGGNSGTGILLYTNYRLPGRYIDGEDQIVGAFRSVKVKIVETGIDGKYKLEHTNSYVTLIHPGRRDVRPHMYVFAQQMSPDESPGGMYIATTVYYE